MKVVEMKVPVIGESISEVTLSSWLKANGEYVNLDEPICEFESDKATLEFPAEASGKLIHVAAEGEDLLIGALVATIDTSIVENLNTATEEIKEEENVIAKTVTAPSSTAKVTGTKVEMKVPVIGESISEVTLSLWLVENESIVHLDEPICEFESDKATLEFPAEATGKIEFVAKEGDDLAIGALVAIIHVMQIVTPEGIEKENDSMTSESINTSVKKASYAKGHPSPSAAKIMAEKGLEPKDISGSGKDGRITKNDAIKANLNLHPEKSSSSLSGKEAVIIGTPFSRNTRREKMSRMRRTIAKRLVSAKNETAMLTTFNEVDLTNIIALRKKYQEQFVEKHGIKLGFMSLFSKACANVLIEMPQINAIIDGNELIYHDFVDISIAISTPTGLVVPPVHNVESLDFHEIETKIKALATKAKEGKLSLDEMKGGTFSITNGGIFESMMSTPILNQPQSAILGMHTIKQRPIAVDGKVEIRPMMYLALSYDHRVIDGSTSVTFLVKVIELLEDPMRLMMNI
ncbi:MAG: 2-oxoglutarate dehydrogenase complex dihydrolipoyllysine-residue succinyltransferase [Saprospiraceae bacterium]